MPKLLTRKDKRDKKNQPIPCDFSASTLSVMVVEQVTQEELRARCTRYYDYLAALQPPQENTMLRATNFTTDSVLQLIQANPSSTFLRVYYGINEAGEHGLFMGAVTEGTAVTNSSTEGTTSTETSTEDPTYVEECCACPPRGNCQDDELLVYP